MSTAEISLPTAHVAPQIKSNTMKALVYHGPEKVRGKISRARRFSILATLSFGSQLPQFAERICTF